MCYLFHVTRSTLLAQEYGLATVNSPAPYNVNISLHEQNSPPPQKSTKEVKFNSNNIKSIFFDHAAHDEDSKKLTAALGRKTTAFKTDGINTAFANFLNEVHHWIKPVPFSESPYLVPEETQQNNRKPGLTYELKERKEKIWEIFKTYLRQDIPNSSVNREGAYFHYTLQRLYKTYNERIQDAIRLKITWEPSELLRYVYLNEPPVDTKHQGLVQQCWQSICHALFATPIEMSPEPVSQQTVISIFEEAISDTLTSSHEREVLTRFLNAIKAIETTTTKTAHSLFKKLSAILIFAATLPLQMLAAHYLLPSILTLYFLLNAPALAIAFMIFAHVLAGYYIFNVQSSTPRNGTSSGLEDPQRMS